MTASTTRSRRPLVLVEFATLVSGTGNSVALIALPWLVLELTGNPTAAGLVASATALPLLVSALFSGTVVDLLGRRGTAIGSDVASALSVAAIPVLGALVDLPVAAIAGLAALGAVFDPAGVTARESLLPDAATRAGVPLHRANAIHEAIWAVAYLVGPGIGAALIAWRGAMPTLWATVAGFVLAVAAVAAVDLPGAGRPALHDRPAGLLRGTGEGLRFVWGDGLLRTIALLTAVLNALYLPVEAVVLPVHFERQGRPGHLGAVLMALSMGAIASTMAYGRWGHRWPRRPLLLGAMIGAGIALVAMSLLPPLPVLVIAAALVGVTYGPVQPLVNLTLQSRAPLRLRGRAIGVFSATEYAAGPLGYLLAGPLINAVGVRATFVGFAVLLLAAALTALPLRSLHALEHLPEPEIGD